MSWKDRPCTRVVLAPSLLNLCSRFAECGFGCAYRAVVVCLAKSVSKVLVSHASDTWALGCMVVDVFASGGEALVNDPTGLFLEASKEPHAAASSSTQKANTDADVIDQLKRRAGGRLMCAHASIRCDVCQMCATCSNPVDPSSLHAECEYNCVVE